MSAKKKLNLVLEGGGAKGIGLVGAIEEFENQGYEWAYLAGTSAGAIVATLMAVGYTGQELKKIIYELDFRKIMDSKGFGKVPLIGPLWNLMKNKGMYNGDYILEYVRKLIQEKTRKNPYTFGDLQNDSGLEGPKLNLMVTDITNRRLLVLPRDVNELGISARELELAFAMRMSMSFPLFFKPVIENRLWIMDGGILSNFPYWYIDGLNSSYPTVGLLLDEPPGDSIRGVWSMVKALLNTMISPLDQAFSVYKQRVIKIDVGGVSTLDFRLSGDKKDNLYQNGRRATGNFLAGFNYQAATGEDLWEGWGEATFMQKSAK